VSVVCAAGFFHWYFSHANQISQMQQDNPVEALLSLWRAARWAVAGFAIFAFALAWSAITSFQIIQASPKS
jgi:hypothetical protein